MQPAETETRRLPLSRGGRKLSATAQKIRRVSTVNSCSFDFLFAYLTLICRFCFGCLSDPKKFDLDLSSNLANLINLT